MTKKNAKNTAVSTEVAPLDMAQFFDAAANAVAEMGAEAEELAAKEKAEADAAAELAALEAATTDADAGQATDEEPAGQDEVELEAVEHVPGDLKTLKTNFTPEEKQAKKDEIVTEFTERKEFEKAQPGLSSKMIPNLEAEEKKMATIGAAGIFLAMDIDPSFINREVSTGSKFNVYALQKVNDLIVALDGGFMQNAINRAIVMSLFNFRDAGVPFTGQAALCAVSDKIKADRAIAKHLVRHTVSANTASTQKSSTMTALKTLGIVTNSGPRGQEVWTLTDTPATRRLEEVVRKAA
ncbi:hypothetical protein SAMN05216358_0050 [Rhizobium sp. AN5]|uniref:hypothetical protein n=1 Tax=Rhizobium sp. AN5 TaxID=1855304 RepID=UPI000BD722DA|nr:hypothetical protein [Rhizobium sp. AN5]SOC90031.1 hypothetical protein SAMN05216358_0050 [Rhizobium sp. AN5]